MLVIFPVFKVVIVEVLAVKFSDPKLVFACISFDIIDEELIAEVLRSLSICTKQLNFNKLKGTLSESKTSKDSLLYLITFPFPLFTWSVTNFLFAISVSLVGVVEIVPVVKSTFVIPFIEELILAFNSAFALLIEVFNSSALESIEVFNSYLVLLIELFNSVFTFSIFPFNSDFALSIFSLKVLTFELKEFLISLASAST